MFKMFKHLMQMLLHSRISHEKFIIQLFDWNLNREYQSEKYEKLTQKRSLATERQSWECRYWTQKSDHCLAPWSKPCWYYWLFLWRWPHRDTISMKKRWEFWGAPQTVGNAGANFWQARIDQRLVQLHWGASLDVGVAFGQMLKWMQDCSQGVQPTCGFQYSHRSRRWR